MNINVNTQDDRTVIALEGMLDSSSAPQFQEVINQQLTNDRLDLILDLGGLAYTSSQGIRAILTLMKGVMDSRGQLVFRNIQPAVREVFDMSGISQAMVIDEQA